MLGLPVQNSCEQMDFLVRSSLLIGFLGFHLSVPHYQRDFYRLTGSDDKKFLLRRSDWFTSREITLIDGREVTAIDPETKQLQLDDGQCCRYDKLVLATGAFPRQLDDV